MIYYKSKFKYRNTEMELRPVLSGYRESAAGESRYAMYRCGLVPEYEFRKA